MTSVLMIFLMMSLTGCFSDKREIIIARPNERINSETKGVIRVAENKKIKAFIDPAEEGKEVKVAEFKISPDDVIIPESTFVRLVGMAKKYNDLRKRIKDFENEKIITSEIAKRLLQD